MSRPRWNGRGDQLAANGGSPWPLKALIPLYVYPTYLGSFWDVIEANPANVGYIIANPDTGPGASVNSDYTTHIANMRTAGIKVLGYVDTDYAGLALSSVKATMSTCGASNINEFQKKARLTVVSSRTIAEGGIHDILTKEMGADQWSS